MSSSPVWSTFQSPSDSSRPYSGRSSSGSAVNNNTMNAFASMGTFGSGPGEPQTQSTFSSSPPTYNSISNREAGIVEKLLPSYGFIQCCERQARLFFHYSQFSGNIEHLKLGDAVEFEMTYDKRTGKPIASMVLKISSDAQLFNQEVNNERLTGFISLVPVLDKEGRVRYENRGECFFLPFHVSDISDLGVILKIDDRVTFNILADKSGNLRACKVSLEAATPSKFTGVVCTLKDSFGFIERSDVVKEIFFHSSECVDFRNLKLGDDVEFLIQTRNNKEVACTVTALETGTVVFEDINPEILCGRIKKTAEKYGNHAVPISRQQAMNGNAANDPFPGRIVYEKNGREMDISYGERDVRGDYTLQSGDYVHFNVVTDRRDNLMHATNILIREETFKVSGEHRDQGYVATLKDTYGFIKCLNREGTKIYFRLTELIDQNVQIKLNDEVEFTIAADSGMPGRLQAIRIRMLPNGTIFKNLFGHSKNSPSSSLSNGTAGMPSPTHVLREEIVTANSYYPSGANVHGPIGSIPHSQSIGRLMNAMTNGMGPSSSSLGSIGQQATRYGDGAGNNMNPYYKNDAPDLEFPLIDLDSDVSPNPNQQQSSNGAASNNGLAGFNAAAANNAVKHNSWMDILSQLPLNVTERANGTVDHQSAVNNIHQQQQANANYLIANLIDNDSPVGAQPSQPLMPMNGNGLGGDYNNGVDQNGSSPLIKDRPSRNGNSLGVKNVCRGFIAALKESYGFIETEDHSKEVFFHYSGFDGNIDNLDIGQEVEYIASFKGNKLNADSVKRLATGSIELESPSSEVMNGLVLRSLRCLNPDQDTYQGLIQLKRDKSEESEQNGGDMDDDSNAPTYEFSITSLADKHEFIQKGDCVQFRLGADKSTGRPRALSVKPIRNMLKASIDAIKGSYGFLNYEVEEGRKLFFHMSEVKANVNLNPGDLVQFVLVQNQRTSKYSALSVVKIGESQPSQRPERLISQMKKLNMEETSRPHVVATRQPKGPDGTKGFTVPR